MIFYKLYKLYTINKNAGEVRAQKKFFKIINLIDQCF